MKNNRTILLIALFILFGNFFYSQNLDSLKKALKFAKQDTTRVDLIYKIGETEPVFRIGYWDTLKTICEDLLIQNKSKGPIHTVLLKNLSGAVNNIGYIYDDQGNIPYALEYYHTALKYSEELNDKSAVASIFINIGHIYDNQKNYPKALEFYNKSLVTKKELNDKKGVAVALNNIGGIYLNMDDYKNAMILFTKSLKLYEDIQNKKGIANEINMIGGVYKSIGNVDKAIEYYNESLKIREEIQDKLGITRSLNSIGNALLTKGKYVEAQVKSEQAMKIAKELGYPENILKTSNLLSKIYSKLNKYKEAYEMHVLYKEMSDSIISETNKKASIQKGFQYAYEVKTAADSIKAAEVNEVHKTQITEQRKQQTLLYIGIGLIAIFSIFMYNRFRVTSKQKGIIELQKVEVERRSKIVEEQKFVIEEKQKEILDSIHYAKRIQQAMLTSESYFDEHLKAEYFIYYQPKDIVSGDFYWATYQHNQFYIATADCTGHGVPGAFMSLLNINFLNENVIERGIKNPAQILDEQRKEIIKALNPKGNENSKDGMDCVLCAFDLDNHILNFSSANNPVWIIRNNTVIEFKGDKMPVGKYEEINKNFTFHSIELKKGDIVYTFTDGFADQFGGEKGKKFKYKQLQATLLANHHLPMAEQQLLLAKTMKDWMGNNGQLDDILVIGVRV